MNKFAKCKKVLSLIRRAYTGWFPMHGYFPKDTFQDGIADFNSFPQPSKVKVFNKMEPWLSSDQTRDRLFGMASARNQKYNMFPSLYSESMDDFTYPAYKRLSDQVTKPRIDVLHSKFERDLNRSNYMDLKTDSY